jgi:putative hydrolase of the HAD superfamily
MSAIRAVVFDLDDTLYPERAYAFSGFDAVAGAFQDRLGDPVAAAEEMRRHFDTEHRGRVFNVLLTARGLPEDSKLIEVMIETYRTHVPTIELHPDADAALTRLSSRFKLGLITDGPAVSQWAKIDALGLRSRFDEIIVTSELGADVGQVENLTNYAKPHPRAFDVIAERLQAEAKACVYVADNPGKDFLAPNALGWTSIQVTRSDGIYRDTAAAHGGAPQYVIAELAVLDDILRKK